MDYTVKPGDTIDKITDRLNISPEQFEQLVDINHLRFSAGQTIFIPILEGLTVRLLERQINEQLTIYDISAHFGADEERIRYFNKVSQMLLEAGQAINLS